MPTLKLEIPPDIFTYVLKIQGEIKSQKGVGKYSQQKAILSIIKEHKELKNPKNV